MRVSFGSLRSVSLMLVFVVGSALCAKAACTGSSPNWTAASAAYADVLACYNAASNGDTINVPAGSSTWTSAITLSKDISIIGAGYNSTTITGSPAGSEAFILDLGHNNRVSGIKFVDALVDNNGSTNAVAGKAFRLDHNWFHGTWSVDQDNINGSCQTPQVHPTGLVDHNVIDNYRFIIDSTNCILTDGNYATQEWAKQPPVGGSGTLVNGIIQEVVYFEDNTFNNNGPTNDTRNWVDQNQAGRVVVRFNTITGAGFNFMEAHSEAGDNRATQWWEYYGNDLSSMACTAGQGAAPCWFTGAYPRGGSGLFWGNKWPNAGTVVTTDLIINNIRACSKEAGGQGKCGGTSTWDQNTPGENGYACRDQIGRSYDSTLWVVGSGAYAQPLTPAYFFNNVHTDGTQVPITVNSMGGDTGTCDGTDYTTADIVANRDYYAFNASFNGTSGIGSGPLSSRPSTCTTGVAYWATDQGSWNQALNGTYQGYGKGNGVLYQCTATNTWTAYYTPYTYPHPLQAWTSGSGGAAPTAPTGLTGVVH